MDHGYFEDRISAYRDKGLPAEEYELIRQHLAECESCRKLHDRLERFDRMVRDHAELGDDLYWERAAQKIEQRLGIAETVVTPVAKKPVWSGLGWKMAAAAASVVLIFIVAINRDKIYKEEELPLYQMAPAVTDTLPAQVTEPVQAPEQPVEATPKQPAVEEEADEIRDEESLETGRMRPVPSGVTEEKSTSPVNLPLVSETAQERTAPLTGEPSTVQLQSTRPEPSAPRRETASGAAAVEEAQVETLAAGEVAKMEKSVESTESNLRLGEAVEAKAAVDTVDQVRLAELESWRLVRDSLEPILAKSESRDQMFDAMAPSSLQREQRAKPKRTAAEVKVELEARYLEACYQVARLATEPSEIKSAKDRLLAVARDAKSPNRDTAQTLLDRLAAGK